MENFSIILFLISIVGVVATLIQMIVNFIKHTNVKKYKQLLCFIGMFILSVIIFPSPSAENTANQEDLNSEVTTAKDTTDEKDETKSDQVFETVNVERVVDGDTIELDTGEKVRLILVDTPETKHPNKGVEYFGQEASDFTTNQLEGKTVYLEKDVSETDKYGRLLRYVWIERPENEEPTKEEIKTKCFNALLLAGGYANVSTFPPDVKYVDVFRELEDQARQSNLGLWGETVENNKLAAVSPPTDTSSTNTSQTDTENVTEPTPVSQSYIGNSNSKKFHYPYCNSVEKMSPGNRVEFNSLEEAINAGYAPCKRCNP